MPKPSETERKIRDFSDIDPGWHFGEGVRPRRSTIEHALRLNTALFVAGFSETDAFLSAAGEIQINGYEGDIYIELVVDLDNHIEFIYEHGDQQQIYQDNLSINDAETKIQFWGRKWHISELFTKITTTHGRGDLRALPLVLHQEMAAYPSLRSTASAQTEEPIANTFTDTTQRLLVPHPSLSNSTRMEFQLVASS